MQIYKDTLAGKVALVTGAGSGIGKATAKLFAYAGARVGLLARNEDELEQVHREISKGHGTSTVLLADVADTAQVEQAIGVLQSTWGRLDIVVANAGINGVWAPIGQLSVADWDRTLNVNLRGTFLTVKHSVPLLKRNGGAIVIISSVNGTRVFSNTGATAYAASKAAQVAFGRMIALELARDRIRVNTVCPGAISTKIDENTQRRDLEKVRVPVEFPEGSIPLTGGAPGGAGQVAQVIWYLASDAADHVTGTEVFVDGGESLVEG